MWRNLTLLHIWHVCDVENVSTYVKIMLLCCKISFFLIYVILLRNSFFVAIYALLCGEKLNQKLLLWRKNYKYQVCLYLALDLYMYVFMSNLYSYLYKCLCRSGRKTSTNSAPRTLMTPVDFDVRSNASRVRFLILYFIISK